MAFHGVKSRGFGGANGGGQGQISPKKAKVG
jgi:hypothetical protein